MCSDSLFSITWTVTEDSWNKEKPFSLIAGSRLVEKAHFISYYHTQGFMYVYV